MSHMILRPKHGCWVLYPSDRPAEREVFDTEKQARKFAAQHYNGVEVIIPRRKGQVTQRPASPRPRQPEPAGLTLGYYFTQAIAKKVEGESR